MPLRDAGAKANLLMGAAANAFHIGADPAYKSLVSTQYDIFTPENACKWKATEPERNHFNFVPCDTVFNFANSSKAHFRGHTLCWGQGNPQWLLNGSISPSEKRSILQEHIKVVAGRYAGRVYGWDVVNEAVADSGGMKHDVWYPDVPDFISVAFHEAHLADPSAVLFYNDYGAELPNAKSDYIHDLLSKLMKQGVPIHGIGFQFHWSVPHSAIPSLDSIVTNFKRFADLGLEIHVTELDVQVHANPCDEKCLEGQAKVYERVLEACLQVRPACKAFITWGCTDKYSWLGEDEHPLPFDQNYQPKPAAFEMEKLLLQ